MLEEYIQMYINAQKENDTNKMDQIEKDTSKLGIDKMTLSILAREIAKETK